MPGIKLSWLADGKPESFNIYRADTSIDINSLPAPIATGITDKTYTDSTVTEGNTYHYLVESVLGTSRKISAEVIANAVNLGSPQNLLFISGNTAPLLGVGEGGRIVTAGPGWSGYGWIKGKYDKARVPSAGAAYCEVKVDERVASGTIAIGIANTGSDIGGSDPAGQYGRYQYFNSGQKRSGGTYSNYGAAYGTGDTIGILMKPVSGKTVVGFYLNGVYQGDAFTLAGVDTSYEMHIGTYLNTTSDKIVLRSPAFAQVPAGAVMW